MPPSARASITIPAFGGASLRATLDNPSTDHMTSPAPPTAHVSLRARALAGSKRLAERATPNLLAKVVSRVEARKPVIQALLAAVATLPPGHTEAELEACLAATLAPFPAELHEECLKIASRNHAEHRTTQGARIPHPGLTPKNRPPRVMVPCPPFPANGPDHPAVHEEWESAHLHAELARYELRPEVLTAWADHELQLARYEAQEHGRKASGDLRRSVPRNLFQTTCANRQEHYEASLRRHLEIIEAIASGDVEVHHGDVIEGTHHTYRMGEDDTRIDWSRTELGTDGITVRIRSERERWDAERAARKAERDALTPEERDARFDALVAAVTAEPLLAPDEPDTSDMFDLPDDPDRMSPAMIDAMIGYVSRASDIAQTKFEKTLTKARTAKRREAATADPEAAKAAQMDKARSMARDRTARRRSKETPEQAAARKARDAAAKRAKRAAAKG